MDPKRRLARRHFVQSATAGTVITALGGLYVFTGRTAGAAGPRSDGRARIPPGQKEIESLRPMGGQEGDPSKSNYRLEVHGEVRKPFTIDFRELLKMEQTQIRADVHCVTGWSVLGAKWKGVSMKDIAERAGVKEGARHVIFEAAHGYTANVQLKEALRDNCMVAHRLDDRPLATTHGAPVRALIPDLYFWKSAKWLTGIRFVSRDQPGYWEVRGYNNHADPWKEERYS